MSFDDVIAQPGAVRTLKRAAATGRIASAYLFEGPSGVGKQRAAIALGQALICTVKPTAGCGTCDPCRRIAAGLHPDVRTFAPRDEGHRNIPVEFLRKEVLPFAQFAPFEAQAALLVFPEADVSFPETHAEAANALLKTLEEPRPRVAFALLSERPNRLLATIRSRCQRVRFTRLPVAVVERILGEHGVPEAARAAAAALSGGRADRAIELAKEGTAEAMLDTALHVDATVEQGKPGSLIAIAEQLGTRDDLQLVLETLHLFYRDVAVAGLGHGKMISFTQRKREIEERARSLAPARAVARADRIRDTAESFERNANPSIALDAMLFGLRDA